MANAQQAADEAAFLAKADTLKEMRTKIESLQAGIARLEATHNPQNNNSQNSVGSQEPFDNSAELELLVEDLTALITKYNNYNKEGGRRHKTLRRRKHRKTRSTRALTGRHR